MLMHRERILENGFRVVLGLIFLVAGLQKRGWEVMHATAESSAASGIVSFRREGGDMAQAHARLAEAGVVTTLRTDRQRRKFIRISPHFYNTDEELHRLLSLV